MTTDPLAWRDHAACHGLTRLFFPELGDSANEAKKVCAGCVVRRQCLDYALTEGIDEGIWGGMNRRSRQNERRRRGMVVPWAPTFQPIVEHGTNAAYQQHRRRGEAICEPCKEAHRADKARRTQERIDRLRQVYS